MSHQAGGPGSLYYPMCWNGMNTPPTQKWFNLNNSLKAVEEEVSAPDGSLVPAYYKKETYSYNANGPADGGVLLQQVALKNRSTYTFSVYLKWSDGMVDEIADSPLDYGQTTTVKIRFPAVDGIYYDQTHLGVKWALPDPNSSLRPGDISGVWVDTEPYQGYQSSPDLYTDSGYVDVGDGWWRVWVALGFNPLGPLGEQALATVMIRPGGVEGPGTQGSEEECPPGEGGGTGGGGVGGGTACAKDSHCPAGWICVEGVCVNPGPGDDGGGTGTVEGCTNQTACNYNPLATLDDGSCEVGSWETCWGCMDDGEQLWSPYPGIAACNYDAAAVWPPTRNPCTYAGEGDLSNRDCEGNCVNDFNADNICDEDDLYGCTDQEACNYWPKASVDDGSCWYPEDGYDCGDVVGCMDAACDNYEPNANIACDDCCFGCDDKEGDDGGGGYTVSYGCLDEEATNYDGASDKSCASIYGYDCCEYECEVGGTADVWVTYDGPYNNPLYPIYPDNGWMIENVYVDSTYPANFPNHPNQYDSPGTLCFHVDNTQGGPTLDLQVRDNWQDGRVNPRWGYLPWRREDETGDANYDASTLYWGLSWLNKTANAVIDMHPEQGTPPDYRNMNYTVMFGGFAEKKNDSQNHDWFQFNGTQEGPGQRDGGRYTLYWPEGVDINHRFHPCVEIQKYGTDILYDQEAKELPIFFPEWLDGDHADHPQYISNPTITYLAKDMTAKYNMTAETDINNPDVEDASQVNRKMQWSFYIKPFSWHLNTLNPPRDHNIGWTPPHHGEARLDRNKWSGMLLESYEGDDHWMNRGAAYQFDQVYDWHSQSPAYSTVSKSRIFKATLSNKQSWKETSYQEDPEGYYRAVISNNAELSVYLIFEEPEKPYLHPRLKHVYPSTHNWDYATAKNMVIAGTLAAGELPPNTGQIGTFHDWGYEQLRGGWVRVWLGVGPEPDKEIQTENSMNGTRREYWSTLEAINTVKAASGLIVDEDEAGGVLFPAQDGYESGFLTDVGFISFGLPFSTGTNPEFEVTTDWLMPGGAFSFFGNLLQSRDSGWTGGPPGDIKEILPVTDGIVNLNSFPPRGEIGAAYVWNPVVNEGNTPASLEDLNPEVLGPVQEHYESYIPRLIYYMLLTESKFFNEGDKWDAPLAEKLNVNYFNANNTDVNVRYIVDHILAQTVGSFPDYFYIGHYKFDVNITDENNLYLGPVHQMNPSRLIQYGRWMTDLDHTSESTYLKRVAKTVYTTSAGEQITGMQFNYRDRDFPIPPWEEEKFYVNCDVSDDLITFLKEQLVIFGVSPTRALEFEEYILANTLQLTGSARVYNNSFLFLTESLEVPPNYEDIISTFDKDKLDYLSLWNGKSSIFDLDVSSGNFDDQFFEGVPYSSEDLFASLDIVHDFSPAGSMARVNVHTADTDYPVGDDSPTIKASFAHQNIINDLSSALGGYGVSAAAMRVSSLGGIGGVIDPTFDFEGYGGRNNHRLLPVFNRDQVNKLSDSLIQGTSALYQPNYSISSIYGIPKDKTGLGFSSLTNASGASAIDVKRNSFRRRNYTKIIPTDSWYRRDGENMPSFLNASDTAFNVLGYNSSAQEYQDISSFHTYHNVWNSCQTINSTDKFFGIQTDNCFPCRGTQDLTYGLTSYYQSRNLLPEYLQTLTTLIEKKHNLEAITAVQLNKPNFDISGSFYSLSDVAKGSIDYGATLEEYTDPVFSDEFHRLYHDYTTKFERHNLGQVLASNYVNGGPNILSHAFGPIYFNAHLSINGSAVDVTNTSLIASSFEEEYIINFNSSGKDINAALNESPIGTYVVSADTSLYVAAYEYRNPHIISGVELVDTSGAFFPLGKENEFSLFKLNRNSSKKFGNQFFNLNTIVLQKSRGGLSRLRFSLRDYDQTKDAENKKGFLLPDKEFELSIESLFGRSRINEFGGGKLGVWIHTKAEYNYHNELVFWNWGKDRKWHQVKASDVTGSKGIKTVKDTLAHMINFNKVYSINKHVEPQASFLTDTQYMVSLVEKDDLQTTKIKFNTWNKDITVPFEYYEAHNQVHRTDQDYIIEVFSYPEKQLDKYLMINQISVVDLVENNRINIPHAFSVPDYTKTFDNKKDYSFYDKTGEEVPFGTPLYVDGSGNIYNEDLGAITAGILRPSKEGQAMFTQVSAYDASSYYNSASSMPQLSFLKGWFTQESYATFQPSSVKIMGTRRGTHVKKGYISSVPMEPAEILNIFRYFNTISDGKASRVATDTSGWNPRQLQNGTSFEFSGGSRQNYRTHPFWDGSGIIVESDQYTSIDIDN
jgi:hypothetical protein